MKKKGRSQTFPFSKKAHDMRGWELGYENKEGSDISACCSYSSCSLCMVI